MLPEAANYKTRFTDRSLRSERFLHNVPLFLHRVHAPGRVDRRFRFRAGCEGRKTAHGLRKDTLPCIFSMTGALDPVEAARSERLPIGLLLLPI